MPTNNNKTTKLSQHFTLEEMTRTSVKLESYTDRQRQMQPDEQVVKNLTRVCQWLEMLRSEWNKRYGEGNDPIIINSGYRSPAVNKAVGGCKTSNHLTGCAADLHVVGKEQLLRYATILLDINDQTHQDFDELLLERNARGYWLHFAVRAAGNRRKVALINVI